MTNSTLWAISEENVLHNSVSDTITQLAMGSITDLSSWAKTKRKTDESLRFPHKKANVSVLIKPAPSYSYLGDGNDLQEDFLGTIDKSGIASRKWVYVMNDVVIRSVIDTFMQADKVDSIYGHVENKVFSLLVFISVSKYDDRLAVQMATYEIDIEDRYTWATFEFHYVPVAFGHDSVITEKDIRYFKRDEYE